MKLFTKEIDNKLFAQYEKGSDMDNQMIVAKIFNPYGRGTWYLMNSDPQDPDYVWGIVDLFEVEMGSISRNELESVKVPPFNLGLERDMYFEPIKASELFKGLQEGKMYAKGGSIKETNKDMVANKATEIAHHAKELHETLEHSEDVPAWVVAKIERSATDISDVAHFLEGEGSDKKYAKGGTVESLLLVLKDESNFNKAKLHFKGESDFYPYEINKEYKTFYFSVDGQEDADSTEYYIEQELQETDITDYYFEFESGNEFKKGGETFSSKTKAVEQRLEGEDVPKEYQKTYGKKYSVKEAKEAAKRIIGAQVAKSKMGKGGGIIGKTKSDKNIYDYFEHPEHKTFNSQDHTDARYIYALKMSNLSKKGNKKLNEIEQEKYNNYKENFNKHRYGEDEFKKYKPS
jgi:hypothetical protein